jgi:hypothetical protein
VVQLLERRDLIDNDAGAVRHHDLGVGNAHYVRRPCCVCSTKVKTFVSTDTKTTATTVNISLCPEPSALPFGSKREAAGRDDGVAGLNTGQHHNAVARRRTEAHFALGESPRLTRI